MMMVDEVVTMAVLILLNIGADGDSNNDGGDDGDGGGRWILLIIGDDCDSNNDGGDDGDGGGRGGDDGGTGIANYWR